MKEPSVTSDKQQATPDQSLLDPTVYGSGKDDSISDITENAAITHHSVAINGEMIPYTARAGHLVIADQTSGQPIAKIFYVSFTATVSKPPFIRPITFFYNGGPGSSAVFLLLGSFGPMHIKTSMPYFTPPAPYILEDNQDSLIDLSDLVFINPVGTGYSAAIAPLKNRDFWGVDEDARSIRQFVKRYLTVFNRWNSPKFLFGESYGTPRTCVLTWLLHEDGVDLNGIILQSSILDGSQASNPVGLLPTLAADAWIHDKVTVHPRPANLDDFVRTVEEFARGPYSDAIATFPNFKPGFLEQLSAILGIPAVVLKYWRLDPSTASGTVFLKSLLLDDGVALGAYDGRVTSKDTGIAGKMDRTSGANDPTMIAIGGVYTAMWNVYLNDELRFTTASPFVDLNGQAFLNWNFGHVDPTGAQKGGSFDNLYTAGDLAAAMALNPYLEVFSANGYFDAITPFFQTKLNFEKMPLDSSQARGNLTIKNYHSGHMIYLDDKSRSQMKVHLSEFYESALGHVSTAARPRSTEEGKRITGLQYYRLISRTPY